MGYMEVNSIGLSIGQIASARLQDRRPQAPIPAPAKQPVKHFINQKMFYWKECFYTRSDVIRWLANRFGGAHLDFRRQADEQHIDEIKNYFGLEMIGTNHKMLIGQEIADGRADPQRRPRIYDATELIAADSARIFAIGVASSAAALNSLLR